MVDRVDINRLLVEMRAIKQQAMPPQANGIDAVNPRIKPGTVVGATEPTVDKFGDLFTQAIDKVNSLQQESSAMAKAYEAGEPGVDITDVMIASQKSSVSFQAMVQVRNKLVDAYRDVMNMPV
ncbi:flagellar hook-basal body complex protein FliE [Simiduia sp. 21SJ11W-1]|uniref:flagellar hook-basal body complex protein FliE n=1 Tax=Simiduia sp. 21SJ11W-1 TaxID=2909669 RepID=UPI00209C9C93|nr:flagellar hook-basal body complex protein FliE [Simiduia sp. 21SJ11W-1]UTA49483.1 flagellar hook-basal body complex protein FliE [Simiduia sp. 21SJ11W-1]